LIAEQGNRSGGSTDGEARVDAGAWVLTSLFHDVAYPLRHVISWANLLGRALTDAEAEVQFVDRVDLKRLFDQSGHGPHFALARETLVDAVISSLKLDKATSQWATDFVREAVERRLNALDHGVWAATVLLHSTDATPPMLQTALAIAFHNGLYQDLSERLKNKDWKFKFTDPMLCLSLLLLLCDALHEWGRDFRRGDEPEGVASITNRPALSRLRLIPKTGDCQRHQIEIDVALGSQTAGAVIERKVKELRELAAWLDPDFFGITIRVARRDPQELDVAGADQYKISIPADL
jgi:hypothetical protein